MLHKTKQAYVSCIIMTTQPLPAWNPDFGFASEHLGSFPEVENPVEEPPLLQGFHQSTQQLSTHAQMYGGTITDQETGQEYYVRLNAPPEPQGNQTWHNGPLDHDWTAYGYNNPKFYFAKKEIPPINYYETNLPEYLADGSGLSTARVELDSRAKFSQGPPRMGNTFPGIREDNGRIAGFHGFQDMNRYVRPDPVTGKEFLNVGDRQIPHIGGQRVQALPIEGRRTVPSGKLDVVNPQLPQQPGSANHLNPLRERIDRINQGTPNAEDQSIYSLEPTQTSFQTSSNSSSNNESQAPIYSLTRLGYNFDTEEPTLLMMRHIQPMNTQSSSYVSGVVSSSSNSNSYQSHPMQDLNLEMPNTGVLHASGGTQQQFQTNQPSIETQAELYKDGSVRTVAQPLSVPAPSVQSDYQTPLQLYKDGTVRTVAQPLSVPAPSVQSDYQTPLQLYKDGSVRTVAQPLETQAQVRYGDIQTTWRKPGEIEYVTPHGASDVRITQNQHTYETTMPKAGMKMLGKSLAMEQPRGVFTGHLKQRYDPRQPNKITFSWPTMHDSRPQELMDNVPQSGFQIRPKEDSWASYSDTYQARSQYFFPKWSS